MTEPRPEVVRDLLIYSSGCIAVQTACGIVVGSRSELKDHRSDHPRPSRDGSIGVIHENCAPTP